MKRLVAMLLVICMLIPTLAMGEEILMLDDSAILDSEEVFGEDLFVDVPEEEIQLPEEELDLILPDDDAVVVKPNTGVNGPDPYRELKLLQPADLSGAATSTTSIRLAWSPVTFASYYEVYRKVGGASSYTKIAQTPDNQLYYEDTSVTPGQVVYYRVQAWNVSYDGDTAVEVCSPQSDTLPFVTLEAPAVGEARGMDEDSLRLTWGSVAGATTYEVESSMTASGSFTPARAGLKGTLCNIDGLMTGVGYYFRVRAVRTFSSGEVFYSDYSDVACGTPMPRPVLSVTGNGSGAVLSWTKCAGATSYIIYRKVGDGAYTKLEIVGDVTTYVDTSLNPGDVCYYFVYASCPIGDYNCFSLSSATKFFTLVSPAVITQVANTGSGEQTIDWTGPDGSNTCPGASHFLVYSATSMDGLYAEIGRVDAGTTTFVASGLEAGKTYYYKVRAIRVFSNGDIIYGPWSNVMYMPEAGVLQLNGLSGVNLTYMSQYGADITGGYTGDVFSWSVKASGGSGKYTFRWSLVPVGGGSAVILKDFSDGYVEIPEDELYLIDSCSITLSDAHISMINDQQYAIQVEVRDSLGALAGIYACGDTYAELTFVGAKPTTKFVNVTMRAGETMTMEHGVYPEAGDTILMDISNPTGAVALNGNEINALSNGYATILVTPERFKNDVLIAYNITVGYATLTINSVTPSTTEMNNYGDLSWDIGYTGGRPDYNVNFKVYRDSSLVVENSRTTSASGILSVNYQPTEPGSYFMEVTVTAADGQTATMRSAVTKVVKYEPVTVTPSATTAAAGTSITWTTEYAGDSTAIRRDYTLYRDGAIVSSSVGTNEIAFKYTPSVAGSYVLKVVVYEQNGNRIETTAATVSVTGSTETGASSGKGTVNAVRVALRKGPSTSYGIILRVDKRETVTVIKNQGDWSYIDYKGNKGWMMSRYITVK